MLKLQIEYFSKFPRLLNLYILSEGLEIKISNYFWLDMV